MLFDCQKLARLPKVLSKFNGGRIQMLHVSSKSHLQQEIHEEFPKLDLIKSREMRRQPRKRWERKEVPPPRYKKMPVNQDWPSVWPVARTFHPASVPLPLHQGHVKPNRQYTPPGKFGNLELMKIPNFLHLTPPAIHRHCEALKKFCTAWPKLLETEEQIQEYFPLEILTTDYLHSSPTIRDFRARIITVRIKVSNLKLEEHAKDKFHRLIGERYDIPSDFFTLVTDCCPLRKQNYDYAMYLLAAVYHESRSIEAWEAEKSEEDFEKYIWEGSFSQKTLAEILSKVVEAPSMSKPSYLEQLDGSIVSADNIGVIKPVQQYRNVITVLHNQGETESAVEDYGNAVRTLFNLPPMTNQCKER